MADYYRYLWSTTWPSLIVLFLIWGVVLSRLSFKILKTWRYAHDAWGFLILTGKVLVWAGVLAIYTELLFFSQPDWLAQPGYIIGPVQGKVYNVSLKSYVLEVGNGTEKKQFYVDKNVYDQLKVEDQVKLTYLPTRREVVRCEVVVDLL